MMRKNMKKRVLAGSVAAIVGGVGFLGMPGNVMTNEVYAKETEKLTQELFKEESVYVKADPTGNASDAIITEWLKNPKKGTLDDETSLQDVKNIKGDETFSETKDDQIQWKSEGEDIYYQGTSTEKLPVGVNVTYKLDGKPISAKELKGKSGKLEMKIAYQNYAKQTVLVDGKETQMYTPFFMATAMILSTDEYKNVEVENGKIISDGDKNIVVGYGVPGLEENLDLTDSKTDIEIPDSVTITANVENVSVGETFTVASCELLNELNLDEIDSFDELEDAMDQLEEAAGELVDGSKDAKDGADQLKDGAKKLKDGTKALSDGASELSDGSEALYEGSNKVSGGIGTLNQKSSTLISGVNSLADGVFQYTGGVLTLRDGSKALYNGAFSLQNGIAQAETATKQQLVPGAKQLMDGSKEAETAVGTMAESLTGASSLVNSVKDAEVTATAKATATATAEVKDVTFKNSVDSLTDSVMKELDDSLDDSQKEQVREAVKAALTDAQKIDGTSVTVTETASDTQTKKVGEDANYQKVAMVVGKTAEGAQTLNTKMQALSKGSESLYGGLNQLANNLAVSGNEENPTIGDGAAGLTAGSKALYDGASALASKNDALNLGTMQLEKGGEQLAAGVKQLAKGSNQVTAGAKVLNNGTITLKQGAASLDEGAGTLYEGTDELADGLQKLADGMDEFKKEGIDEIADVFNGDFQKVKARIQAMADLSESYKSFAGIKEGMDGSTKFIIETEGVE